MLDAIQTTTTTRPARQTGPAAPVMESTPAAGQNPPADGTKLPAGASAPAPAPELPRLERLAESLTAFARSLNRDLSFSVHEASGHTVVKVLDGETREVIRQIPSEEFLRISEALDSNSALLIDTEA